jgi:hypothetical protein
MQFTLLQIQGVRKLPIQKSSVTSSETEETIWSLVFQKQRLVLKFSFKPPDGILLVQSCSEILLVAMQSYTG